MSYQREVERQLFKSLSSSFSEEPTAGSTPLAEKLHAIATKNASSSSEGSRETFDNGDECTTVLRQLFDYLKEKTTAGSRSLNNQVTNALGVAARTYDVHDLLRDAGTIQHALRMLEDLETFDQCDASRDDVGSKINARSEWLSLRFGAWRLLANMGADDDASREIISQPSSLKTIIAGLKHDALAFAPNAEGNPEEELKERCRDAPSTVLFNLLGYEPARERCQDAGLVEALHAVIKHYNGACSAANPGSSYSLPSMVWEVLEETMIDWGVERSPQDFPENILEALIRDEDSEVGDSTIKAVSSHLKSRRFSSRFASSPWLLWLLVCHFYNLQGEHRVDVSGDQKANYTLFAPLEEPPHQRSEAETDCLQSIADVAEQPELFSSHRLSPGSEICQVADLLKWPANGAAGKNENIVECACMILGNYASSDSICQSLVLEYMLGDKVLEVLKMAKQYSTRYMATALLKNLAVPKPNKEMLAKGGLVFRHLDQGLHETVRGELLQVSISAARVLITPSNALHMTSDSETDISGSEGNPGSSFLAHTLSLAGQADDQGIKVEAGRLLKRLLQCIYKECDERERGVLESRLCGSKEDLKGPLAAMVLQTQNAVVRSEGWLAMALFARTDEGASKVRDTLSQEPVHKAMKAAVLMQDLQLQQDKVQPQDQALQVDGTEEEQVVHATGQQQVHDRDNIQLLLKVLADKKLQVEVDGEPVDMEKLSISSSLNK